MIPGVAVQIQNLGRAVAALVNSPVLTPYVGQRIDEICGRYGRVGDSFNHCAHFVSHALQLRLPGAALCSNVEGTTYPYAERRNGFCIRVNQVYNSLANREAWPAGDVSGNYIIVATIPANIVERDPPAVGTMSRKHIGFYVSGDVIHYSNTRDRVVMQRLDDFRNHYGATTVLLKADMP